VTHDADQLAVAGDIGEPATARRVIDETIKRFGRVDTLVNNTGIFVAKPFAEYTAEDFTSLINVNLAGCKSSLPWRMGAAGRERHACGRA
jgi:NAD(P)-dependent dehydrogenase (short-subunit alcohol dehydrogenase family)